MTEKFTLRIDSAFMETCGSNTLSGALANKYGAVKWADMKEVTLQFIQTPLRYREKHGPDHWVMPEYSVMCLADNLVHLKEMGLKVTIEEILEEKVSP